MVLENSVKYIDDERRKVEGWAKESRRMSEGKLKDGWNEYLGIRHEGPGTRQWAIIGICWIMEDGSVAGGVGCWR